MALTGNINIGMVIKHNNEPHLVIERNFYAPGRGYGITKTKIKSLISGKVITQTFRSNDKVEELYVENKSMQYLYVDSDSAVFMDPTSFEQIFIPLDSIPGGVSYLHTDAKYVTMFYDGNPISVKLPGKITLKVTDTSDAVKGNTSGGATKKATLETDLEVQVPLFIKLGEKIVINTDSGQYVEKADS